jgi:NADP-dependent aldehyde dehydrogenase
MELVTQHFLAGRHAAAGSDTFRAEDAASGQPLEPAFHEAVQADIDAACEAAAAAADEWRDLPLEQRAAFLEAVAAELDATVDAFVERAPRETGLPEARIRGELARTTGQLRLFAQVVRSGDFLGVRIDTADADRKPVPKPDLRHYRIPLGPVAVFGASNFPLAFSTAGGDTASAWAAGCPVVVKGHPAHPGTSALAAAAIERAVARTQMPEGVFSLVQGRSNAVGAALVQHPAIRAVGFTGSHAGGMALTRLAAERPVPIPVYAEMGSVNPLFLLPGALAEDPETLANGFVGSLTLGCGQFCTNPGIIVAVRGEALEQFLGATAKAVAEVAPGVMLHSGILKAYEQGRQRLASVEGVTEVGASSRADSRAVAAVYRTTAAVFRANPDLAQEVFGPTSLIVEVDDRADMLGVAEAMAGQLTATVHGTPAELTRQTGLLRTLERIAGRVLFNGFPTGVEVSHAMVHGGPYPATSDSRSTSVGTLAIDRFLRPVCYQNFPSEALPKALRDDNPLKLNRLVNGEWETA